MVVTGLTGAEPERVDDVPDANRALRVGVLGSGFMGRVHAESARRAGARIVGAVGSSSGRADAAAAATGAANGFGDLDSLLREAEPDVVHVCTPNTTHAELTDACLAAGAHVVCEKPLATAAGDAEKLVAAAQRARRVGAVPFVYRFHAMARELRARVAAGEAGIISLVHGGYLQDWMSRSDDENWRVRELDGGPSRAFADIGSHWCDLLEFVLDERIAALSAQTGTARAHRGAAAEPVSTEDTVTLQLRTTSGVLGTGVICQVAAGRKNHLHLEISGTAASMRFEQEQPERLWVGGRGESRSLVRDPETLSEQARPYSRLPAGHGQGYQDCFDFFVAEVYAAIRNGDRGDRTAGLPTFSDGLRAARLTEAVLKSAADGGAWTEP